MEVAWRLLGMLPDEVLSRLSDEQLDDHVRWRRTADADVEPDSKEFDAGDPD